ncbi:MAG: ATP-dependent Clp protease proteolytic subunit [Bacteroidales bacterium]|nr:ATP-dependent Clp protease proteolytic subunit [Bacteroidales bacterium]
MREIDNILPEFSESFSYDYMDRFEIEDDYGRRIFINCDIDEDIIENAVYHIMRYNREDKDVPIKDRKPILVYINSAGGSVIAGYGLIDAIRLSKTPVYTINLAFAASMGFLIFIAGHKRYAMPHSVFLMHDGSTMGYGSTAKMRDRMEFETIELEKETKKYIQNRTNIDDKMYDEKYRVEWYFLPSTAKDIGATDYIVGEDCEFDEII